ncbi:hypothetical protein AVEN_212922-1 [Araneus ventricosus]|uniref:Uncharacterized protein n=1 Tax=Araneus ventricosus TaxID=182803 RepID=A0A4Y2WYP5_ARAVE|nr:hypothetical protein AVEN_212922-1 [Araneus ventricosus]
MTRTTPELALLSPSSRTTPTGWHLHTTSDLARTRHIHWNRIANMESSKLEAKTLPPGHRQLYSCKASMALQIIDTSTAFTLFLKPAFFLKS